MIRLILIFVFMSGMLAGGIQWHRAEGQISLMRRQIRLASEEVRDLENQRESLSRVPAEKAASLQGLYARLYADVEAIVRGYQLGVHWSDGRPAAGSAGGGLQPAVAFSTLSSADGLAQMRLALRFSGLQDRYRTGALLEFLGQLSREYPLRMEFCRLHQDVMEVGLVLKGEN